MGCFKAKPRFKEIHLWDDADGPAVLPTEIIKLDVQLVCPTWRS
jgi:hypothetical protein